MLVAINILGGVILNEVKDLTIDSRPRKEICVFKTSIVIFDALPPERNFPRPVSIKLTIGDALAFESTSNDRMGWSQIAASVESAVRNLIAR